MPYTFQEVEGVRHVVLTKAEWKKLHRDYKGTVTPESRLHTEFGWSVGTKTALVYDNGTCLAPVVIKG